MMELKARGMRAQTQVPGPVRHKRALVGTYLADIIVDDELILGCDALNRMKSITATFDSAQAVTSYYRSAGAGASPRDAQAYPRKRAIGFAK